MGDYVDYARRLRASGLVPDPWYDGAPRFREAPLILDIPTATTLVKLGMRVARVVDAAADVVARHPELLEDFLRLTPVQQLMWKGSAPAWHGMARADAFETEDGRWVACELNSDTPTGQPEAVVASRLAKADHPELVDPNQGLGRAWAKMVADSLAFGVDDLASSRPMAGIVYPTEMTEDIHTVELLYRWLDEGGYDVVLGSPFQLTERVDGGCALAGQPIDVMIRHYKTDWWSERLPVWDDEDPVQDSLPLVEQLHLVLGAQQRRRLAVVNPFGAVLSQNKRLMALMWERIDLFSPEMRALIHAHIPRTLRMEALHLEQLRAEKEQWVLKTDYGCEGEEVFLGSVCTESEWDAILEHALAERWVAQAAFVPKRNEEGFTSNFGPYIVAGRVVGLYGRIQRAATDHDALSVPVLVTGSTRSNGA